MCGCDRGTVCSVCEFYTVLGTALLDFLIYLGELSLTEYKKTMKMFNVFHFCFCWMINLPKIRRMISVAEMRLLKNPSILNTFYVNILHLLYW